MFHILGRLKYVCYAYYVRKNANLNLCCSLPLATSVPVHDDTGEFQHSCKDTTMAFPQIIFQRQ